MTVLPILGLAGVVVMTLRSLFGENPTDWEVPGGVFYSVLIVAFAGPNL